MNLDHFYTFRFILSVIFRQMKDQIHKGDIAGKRSDVQKIKNRLIISIVLLVIVVVATVVIVLS